MKFLTEIKEDLNMITIHCDRQIDKEIQEAIAQEVEGIESVVIYLSKKCSATFSYGKLFDPNKIADRIIEILTILMEVTESEHQKGNDTKPQS